MKHVRWWLSGRVSAFVAVLFVLGCAGRSTSNREDGRGGSDAGGSSRGGTDSGGSSRGGSVSGSGRGGADSGGSGTDGTGGATTCIESDPMSCPTSQTCLEGACFIVLEDPNNYIAVSRLSIPSVETARTGDLTVCWTDVTTDLACGDVNPETDIGAIALIRTTVSEETLAEALSAGALTMSMIDGYIQYETDQGTCTELSSFSNLGSPVDVADYYAETSNLSYLFVANRGTAPGIGSVSMVFARPVSTSTNTTVDLPPGCGLQKVVADLAAADPVRVPYDAPFVIHYGYLTRDGLGNSLFLSNLDGLVLSFFADATLAELEAHILDLDAMATESFELELSGGSTVSLYQAMSPESGQAFAGFRRAEAGIWLLRLTCTFCSTALPPVLVVLEPF